jgi:hypothetical protein
MVGGFRVSSSGNGAPRAGSFKRPNPAILKPQTRAVAAIPDKRGGAVTVAAAKPITKSVRAMKAEEVIPLDDNDLMEF